jgi:hypothetical protein
MTSFKILKQIFEDEEYAITFLIDMGVILPSRACTCGQTSSINRIRRTYRCNRKSCRKENSIFNESFFYRTHLKINEILHLSFLWLCGATSKTVELYFGYSDNTIASYFLYFRELVADALDEQDFKIGGPNIVVEIDESKFGKRKYHVGHRVDGVWVFGGVERTQEGKIFLVVVPDRSEETLLRFIQAHILPGSIIISDLWRGYRNINEKLSLMHLTVNHSRNFVDENTGAHTNTIEGSWCGIKRKIPIRNRTQSAIDLHLLEFIWRRINENSLWEGFITALKDVLFLN